MTVDTTNQTEIIPRQKEAQKIYRCNKDSCDKAYRFPHDLRRHLKNHDVIRRFKCEEPKCKAVFLRLEKLQLHQQVKHCGQRPFKCDYAGCNKSYKDKFHLKRHKILNHSSNEQAICAVKGCGKIYSNKYVLKQHIASAHGDKGQERQIKKKSDIEKRHKCDEPGCNAEFRRPYRLKNHKLTYHGDEKPFKCNYENCDKSYTNQAHLTRHQSITHTDETDTAKEVICGVENCGKIFSDKYNLKKHITRNHTKFRFLCTVCNTKFNRKSQLNTHKTEEHGVDPPYRCSKCPETFINLHLYNKHSKTHKIYECDCEKTFSKWSKLLEHRRTECTIPKKEHKCIICEKKFTLKRCLTLHSLSVHIPDSQVDLFKCPYLNCKRSYKYKTNLQSHVKTYHEKLSKKVICTEKNCNLVFKSNRNMKQHVRVVHNDLPAKVRKPRKPRKDKGKPKKSMASKISGMEVSVKENYRNIHERCDDHLTEKILQDILPRVDKADSCKFYNYNNTTESGKDNTTFKNADADQVEHTKKVVSMELDCTSKYATNSNLNAEINRKHFVNEPVEFAENLENFEKKVLRVVLSRMNSNGYCGTYGSRSCEEDSAENNIIEDYTSLAKSVNPKSTEKMDKNDVDIDVCMEVDSECSRLPLVLADSNEECISKLGNSEIVYEAMSTNDDVNASKHAEDNMSDVENNLKSYVNESVELVKVSGINSYEEIIIYDQNGIADVSNDALTIDSDNLKGITSLIPAENQSAVLQNSVVKVVEVGKSDCNTKEFEIENNTTRKTAEIPGDVISNLEYNTNPTFNQNGCNSDVLIIDFPEYEDIGNTETSTEVNLEESSVAVNDGDSRDCEKSLGKDVM